MGGIDQDILRETLENVFAAVNAALNKDQAFDDEHYNVYKDQVTSFEKEWWEKRIGTFNPKPVGDSKTIAKELVDQYKSRILDKFIVQ